MKHAVYLAGPISGLTFKDAEDWRQLFSSAVNSDKIECLSPLRGKEYLRDAGVLHSGTYDKSVLTSGKGITRRDYFDCTRSSVVVVNLLGALKPSIGTIMEIAWAYRDQIPSIVIMEPDNLHHHVMIEEASTYTVETLEEAATTLKFLLNDKESK